jgi:hypothetical protein
MDDLDRNDPLFAEILAEQASAYFTTVRKMQAALAALQVFDEQQRPMNAANNQQRTELFAEAAEQVWFFVVQREAMKLTHYEELFADFGIPDEVRRRMGPRL